MDERTFWELVAQFLNAQQNPPDGPYAAVGADPYANDLPPLAPRFPGTTYMGNGSTGTRAPTTSNATGGPTQFEDGSYANNGGIESRYYPYMAVNAFPQYDRPRDPQMGQILRQFQHGLDQHQQHPNMRHEAQIEHSYRPVAGQPSMSERRGPKRQPRPKNDPPVTTPSTPPIPVKTEAKKRVTTVPPKQQVRPGTSRPSHYGPAPKPAPVNTSAPRYVPPATQRGSFQGIRTSATPSVATIAKNMLRPKR